MFETKIAFIVRDDLQAWQRLNVVAFLATGTLPRPRKSSANVMWMRRADATAAFPGSRC